MTFINNSANRGGALSVRSASVGIDNDIIRLFNTRCFFQYEIESTTASLAPSKWKVWLLHLTENIHKYYVFQQVSLNFINNTAKTDGAAVYATDVERCTHTPSINLTSSEANAYERSIFSLKTIIRFKGNRVERPGREVQEVATAPARFNVKPEVKKKKH